MIEWMIIEISIVSCWGFIFGFIFGIIIKNLVGNKGDDFKKCDARINNSEKDLCYKLFDKMNKEIRSFLEEYREKYIFPPENQLYQNIMLLCKIFERENAELRIIVEAKKKLKEKELINAELQKEMGS